MKGQLSNIEFHKWSKEGSGKWGGKNTLGLVLWQLTFVPLFPIFIIIEQSSFVLAFSFIILVITFITLPLTAADARCKFWCFGVQVTILQWPHWYVNTLLFGGRWENWSKVTESFNKKTKDSLSCSTHTHHCQRAAFLRVRALPQIYGADPR